MTLSNVISGRNVSAASFREPLGIVLGPLTLEFTCLIGAIPSGK